MRKMYSENQIVKVLENKDVVANSIQANSIQGNEVVELNNGITFTKANNTSDKTFEYIYCGATKQGNTLNLVYAFKLTILKTINNTGCGKFIVPKSIADKIYPTTIGSVERVVAIKDIRISSNGTTSYVKPATIFKNVAGDNGELTLNIYGLNSELSTNTAYYCRCELTILLSDNLAS